MTNQNMTSRNVMNETLPPFNQTMKPRSRFHPRTWSTSKKLSIGLLGAVVLTGLWAAFRPERLFVNNTVSESLATGKNAPTLVAQGNFSSLAHHTEGLANLYRKNSGYLLRLSQFSTSNGPDVHVYVTQEAGIDNASIKSGKFLDLGVIKGNIGDQNYILPTSFNPARYQGVSIWCRRFGVNFAGADLGSVTSAAPQTSQPAMHSAMHSARQPAMQAAAPQSAMQNDAKSVTVTTGTFVKVGESVKGNATITEDAQGNRTLTLTNFQSAQGPDVHVYLVKAEDARSNDAVKKATFLDLGSLKARTGTQTYRVPKNIDLWQYLAVTIWCDKFKVNFATAPLHSPQ